MHTEDTIAAVASAAGGALRGIVRVSGVQALEIIGRCLNDAAMLDAARSSRAASVISVDMRLPRFAAPLPVDLHVWPVARSYTREPTIELHTLGSPPLVDALLSAVCAAGARLAQPGEFTLRAFLAGRIDLPQAEAVLGVIDALDRRNLDVALAQLAGNVSRPLNVLRESLLDLLAHLEAGLDFADEDIEFISASELNAQLTSILGKLNDLTAQLTTRNQVNRALQIVLVGPPNAGKSSLFNRLTGQNAIVSTVAGTTRDVLMAPLVHSATGNIAADAAASVLAARCRIIDTAGIDSTGIDSAAAESAAFEAAYEQAAPTSAKIAEAAQRMMARERGAAFLELVCIPRDEVLRGDHRATLPSVHRINPPIPRWLLLTKCDVEASAAEAATLERNLSDWMRVASFDACFSTSSHTGNGTDEVTVALLQFASEATHSESAAVATTAARCEESLNLSRAALTRACETLHRRDAQELVAAELRHALAELGKIVGAVYTDDILDRIFSRFCIGK